MATLVFKRADGVEPREFILAHRFFPAPAISKSRTSSAFQIGKLLTTPCVKFVAQAASYLFFLGLILVNGQVEQGKLCPARVVDLGLPLHHLETTSPATRMDSLSGAATAVANMTWKDIGRMCIRNHKPAVMEVCIVLWISGDCLPRGVSNVAINWDTVVLAHFCSTEVSQATRQKFVVMTMKRST